MLPHTYFITEIDYISMKALTSYIELSECQVQHLLVEVIPSGVIALQDDKRRPICAALNRDKASSVVHLVQRNLVGESGVFGVCGVPKVVHGLEPVQKRCARAPHIRLSALGQRGFIPPPVVHGLQPVQKRCASAPHMRLSALGHFAHTKPHPQWYSTTTHHTAPATSRRARCVVGEHRWLNNNSISR